LPYLNEARRINVEKFMLSWLSFVAFFSIHTKIRFDFLFVCVFGTRKWNENKKILCTHQALCLWNSHEFIWRELNNAIVIRVLKDFSLIS
jgi:hypothetical protein